MSEIYASDVHYSVNGAKDILLKIKNFAQAQGWTVVSYLTNVEWLSDGDGTYSWQSGTEDFLELLSNGYGSQALRYRFYTMFDVDDPNNYWLYFAPVDHGYPTIDETSSNIPVGQHTWQYNPYGIRRSVPPSVFPAMYLFGNSRTILFCTGFQLSSILANGFGTAELFSEFQTITQAQFHWTHYCSSSLSAYKWYSIIEYPTYYCDPIASLMSTAMGKVWWSDTVLSSSNVRANFYLQTDGVPKGYFNSLVGAVTTNSWTGKKTLIQPTLFIKNQTSGVWEPVGRQPVHYVEMGGLSAGEKINFGSEEYTCFPFTLNTRQYGMAIRTA